MKDYLNYDGLAVMAHRGGSLEAPENTIESFRYSLEIGSDIIETDIQLSSDGVPYIFHDDDLTRIPGIEKNFNELQWVLMKYLSFFLKALEYIEAKLVVIACKYPFIDMALRLLQKDL